MGAMAPALILTNHTTPKDIAIMAATGIVGLVTNYCGLKDIKWNNGEMKKIEKRHKETLEERAELAAMKSKYRPLLN